jgi:NitT/TauT family transport system ATP-binding protein
MSTPVIQLQSVSKSFRLVDGSARSVLDGVDFTLHEGEIVAMLGQSGSGKSTMLRIMAGLLPADGGRVLYGGMPLFGPARGISMVFQSFALFPWLTVEENVAIGLEAQGMPAKERAERAQEAVELIGLSGFEGALPRELSGGMRQRVGIARALVMQPEVLLMDEAFSALDVLTGERLREDILELWQAGKIPTKAILVVSHSIQEAVVMADRVLIFASNPGRIRSELPIALARPRQDDSPQVRSLVDEVYGLMTAGAIRTGRVTAKEVTLQLGDRLPDADSKRIEGLLELLADEPYSGQADLPKLADDAELTDKELLDATRALTLLGFVNILNGDMLITPLGLEYVEADNARRQQLFGAQLMANVPLVAYIRQTVERDPSGDLPDDIFLRMLCFTLSEEDAEKALRTGIEWGRHGDLYEFDFKTGVIHLPREASSTVT